MSSTDSEKCNSVEGQENESRDTGNEAENNAPVRQTSLAPLTIGLCLAVFLLAVDRTIIAVAAPQISNQFNSFGDIGWYGSAYLITLCCVQPVFGKVYTIFNTKWTYVWSFTMFEIGSLICALSPGSTVLIIGRALAGVGAGGVLSGSYVITAQTVPIRIRPAYTAAVAMMFSLGAIVAPLLGAAFTQNTSWRWCFYINLPIGCPVLVGLALFFHPPENSVPSADSLKLQEKLQGLDIIGASLFFGAILMLLMALQHTAESRAWSSSVVSGLLCGATVAVILLASWQWRKGDEALIPPRIVCQRTVLASTIANIAMYAALVAYIYFLVIYFQAIKGRSVIASAVDLLPIIICSSAFSIIAGILVTKTLYFTSPAIMGSALAFIGSGLLTTLRPSTSNSHVLGFQVLVGIGMGLALQTGFFGVQAVLPSKDVPVATSLVTLAQSLGGALAVSIGNSILLSSLRSRGAELKNAGIPVHRVIHAGATGFQDFVSRHNKLDMLLDVYNHALSRVFIMACVFSGVACFATCFMEFRKTVDGTKSSEVATRDGRTDRSLESS